jgi:hypothetical protein
MKSFKNFCEQAFHPDLVIKVNDPEVQKNLRSTVIPPGQRYASGPPEIKVPEKKPIIKSKNSFLDRIIRNAPY